MTISPDTFGFSSTVTPTNLTLLSQDALAESGGELVMKAALGLWGQPWTKSAGARHYLPWRSPWKTEMWLISGQTQTSADAQSQQRPIRKYTQGTGQK